LFESSDVEGAADLAVPGILFVGLFELERLATTAREDFFLLIPHLSSTVSVTFGSELARCAQHTALA
jgi:hypothetical protein